MLAIGIISYHWILRANAVSYRFEVISLRESNPQHSLQPYTSRIRQESKGLQWSPSKSPMDSLQADLLERQLTCTGTIIKASLYFSNDLSCIRCILLTCITKSNTEYAREHFWTLNESAKRASASSFNAFASCSFFSLAMSSCSDSTVTPFNFDNSAPDNDMYWVLAWW